MERHYETRDVLAGAYRAVGTRDSAATMLTHVVLVCDGEDTGVLCHRVQFENVADTYAMSDAGRAAAATCPECARKDPRQFARGR